MDNKFGTIFVIGAGAIGKALAVFLSLEGRNVVLLRGHIDDNTEYTENIEVTLYDGKIINRDILVSTVSNYSNLDGLIVLTTKSYSNQQISGRLKFITGSSPVIILQNGLHVETPFINNGFTEIYRCVLFATSQYTADKRLRFKPASASPIGIIRGSGERLAFIVECLNNPYLIFQPAEDIQSTIWTKTIINCVFNSVCPLLEIDNGIFHRNAKARVIAKHIIGECIAVAEAEGVVLEAEKVFEVLLLISKASEGQLISTYQDIINKRKTEIETLNITMALLAEKWGKESLVSETRLLGELIQIKSEITMQS